jgi:8-oxo-dGTP pyrophosphatase MutT (NUDIX family)
MSDSLYRRPDKVIIYLYRRTVSGQIEYLLLQRRFSSKAGRIWQTAVGSAQWSEDLVEAARREVFEETGLTRLQGITAIGYAFHFPFRLPEGYISEYAPEVCAIRNTVFAAEVVSARPIHLSHEHVAYDWFSLEVALNKVHWPEEREALTRLHPMLSPILAHGTQ